MAREFAKPLYHSKEWQRVRECVIVRDEGLCQECLKKGLITPGEEVHHIEWLKPSNINDANITLNTKNLEYVCKDCHFEIHKEVRNKLNKRLPSITNGTYFDDKGNLCKVNNHIVYGAPGSGKNRYVSRHREYGDLVVDLDAIKQALSMEDKGYYPDNLHDIATGVRDYLYDLITNRKILSKNIWIIASLPRKKERQDLRSMVDAELIFIDEDIDTCIAHVINDEKRNDKKKEIEIINQWFGSYEK